MAVIAFGQADATSKLVIENSQHYVRYDLIVFANEIGGKSLRTRYASGCPKSPQSHRQCRSLGMKRLGIPSAQADEFVVAALFDDLPAVDHENHVGISNG